MGALAGATPPNEPGGRGGAGDSGPVGALRTCGAESSEPGVILFGGRGTVTVGEAFGPAGERVSPRAIALRNAWRDFDERAIGAYRKAGFVEEGRFKDHNWFQGSYRDLVWMYVFRP